MDLNSILQGLGAAASIAEEMRRMNAQSQAAYQQRMEAQRRNAFKPDPTAAQQQLAAYLLHRIYGPNARFFKAVTISEAEWSA